MLDKTGFLTTLVQKIKNNDLGVVLARVISPIWHHITTLVQKIAPQTQGTVSAHDLLLALQTTITHTKNPEEIYKKLQIAVEQQLPVQIHEIGVHRAQFVTIPEDDDYLKARVRLLLVVLDQTDAFVQLKPESAIHIQFFLYHASISAQLFFRKIIDQELIELSYPTELTIEEEKQRSSVRVNIGMDWDVSILVRSSPFQPPVKCKLAEISTGGASFYSLRRFPFEVKNGITVFMNLRYPEVPKGFNLRGVITGSFFSRSTKCYRVRFILTVHELIREVEEMVMWAQRYSLQLRKNALELEQAMEEEKRTAKAAQALLNANR